MNLIQSGSKSARILICGEAPPTKGSTEIATGEPFVGGAGMVLNQTLHKAGISRSDCFITNIAHVQPPGNKFEWFFTAAGQIHLLQGIAQLAKDIREVRPNVIVALGTYPTQILTGKKGITKYRGSILPSTLVPGFKVIPSFHPAYCMRVYEAGAILGFDLQRVAKHREGGSLTYPKRRFYIPGNKAIHRVGTEWVTDTISPATYQEEIDRLHSAHVLGVDIECWQRDDGSWKLACVAFSSNPSVAVVVSGEDFGTIQALCENSIPKVYQNGQFDVTVLRDNGMECKAFWWDTMIAHHILFAEASSGQDEISVAHGKKRMSVFQKGLAFQTSVYTEEPFYKDDGKLWKQTEDLDMFYRYNALDAAVTMEIQRSQQVDLKERQLMEPFREAMRHNEVCMHSMWRGLRVDMAVREQLTHQHTTLAGQLQASLDALAGGSVNVKSSQQVQHLLYDKLKLPSQYKRGTGRPTADKDAIHALAGRFSHPVLSNILGIRESRDMLERYLVSPVDGDGRYRCSFDPTGTRSYRLASRASIYGSGGNLQNVPDALRRMYIPDEGCVFLYPDFSQAEARVVAVQARCQGLIELFTDPSRDVHRENAARIFGKSVESISPIERYLAKRVVHAANYGMEAKRLAAVVNEDATITGVRISTDEAQHLLIQYFLLYPEIKEVFWRGVERELKRTRTLTNPFGLQRTFYGRMDDALLREAYSWVPQSTVGWLGRMAWARTYAIEKQHPSLGLRTLCQVHDSILSQVPTENLHIAIPIILDAMRIPITLNGITFTIPVDIQIGSNWGHASEDNPNGLKEWAA